MKRRKGQVKKKARLKRQKTERKAAAAPAKRTSAAKRAPKAAAAPAPVEVRGETD